MVNEDMLVALNAIFPQNNIKEQFKPVAASNRALGLYLCQLQRDQFIKSNFLGNNPSFGIRFSKHAFERMQERLIDQNDVISAVKYGKKYEAKGESPAVYNLNYSKGGKVPRDTVVAITSPDGDVVITTYRVNDDTHFIDGDKMTYSKFLDNNVQSSKKELMIKYDEHIFDETILPSCKDPKAPVVKGLNTEVANCLSALNKAEVKKGIEKHELEKLENMFTYLSRNGKYKKLGIDKNAKYAYISRKILTEFNIKSPIEEISLTANSLAGRLKENSSVGVVFYRAGSELKAVMKSDHVNLADFAKNYPNSSGDNHSIEFYLNDNGAEAVSGVLNDLEHYVSPQINSPIKPNSGWGKPIESNSGWDKFKKLLKSIFGG